MNRYPKFKILTPKGELLQEGKIDLATLIDSDPLITYYDEYGIETMMPRKEPYEWGTQEFQKCKETMASFFLDDNFEELMEKYQDENKTIEREGYILIINEGEK